MSGTHEGAIRGWITRRRQRGKVKSKLPGDKQRVQRKIGGILRKGHHPYVAEQIRRTPSTGHLEGSSRKMVREVDNWPQSWMPAGSLARRKLKQDIARDPGETYVYYPIGSHRPVIYSHNRRYTLDEYQQRYG